MGLVASKRTQGIIYGALALVWIALDQVTKAYFASTYALGQSSQGSWVLFDFQLVNNKGAAWGMFSDS
ncbi:MAG: signal peptidase II, partial [Eggerthellales bacterium]|nr:signal peptidase II [Eggerthellales bacterium]